jgi:hypothetical protein
MADLLSLLSLLPATLVLSLLLPLAPFAVDDTELLPPPRPLLLLPKLPSKYATNN